MHIFGSIFTNTKSHNFGFNCLSWVIGSFICSIPFKKKNNIISKSTDDKKKCYKLPQAMIKDRERE